MLAGVFGRVLETMSAQRIFKAQNINLRKTKPAQVDSTNIFFQILLRVILSIDFNIK